MPITTLTDKQKADGFAAGHAYVLNRLQAEVPSMFEKQAESMLEKPEHRAELAELVRRIGLAVLNAGDAP